MSHNSNLVLIKTKDGYLKYSVNDIKYINIEKRNLCYHLTDGTSILGQYLRTSFAKSLGDIKENDKCLFLPPSLVVNLQEIKLVNKNYIEFNDGEIYYISQCKYQTIYNKWSQIL